MNETPHTSALGAAAFLVLLTTSAGARLVSADFGLVADGFMIVL